MVLKILLLLNQKRPGGISVSGKYFWIENYAKNLNVTEIQEVIFKLYQLQERKLLEGISDVKEINAGKRYSQKGKLERENLFILPENSQKPQK